MVEIQKSLSKTDSDENHTKAYSTATLKMKMYNMLLDVQQWKYIG